MTSNSRQRPDTSRQGHVASFARSFAVLLVAATTLACSQKTLPAYGEVLLLLSSDMPVPNSFDTLIIKVNGQGRAFRDKSVDVPNSTDPSDPCGVGNGTSNMLSNTSLKLPTTIALTSERDEAQPNTPATLIVCKGGQVVFSRGFTVDLPASGQVLMMRAPIRWLCSNKPCYGCGDNGDEPSRQSCHHRAISRIANPPPGLCEASACANEAGVFTTIDYDQDEANRYDPAQAEPGSCFDPWSCFDMTAGSQFETRAWVQVPTGWQDSQPASDAGTSSAACAATLPQSLIGATAVNVAVVLPPENPGYCDSVQNRCVVPLDSQASVGWTWPDRSKETIHLPEAVCHMLDSGQILYVIAAANADCESKTPATPLCRKSKPPTSGADAATRLLDFATAYLPLDDALGAPPGSLLEDETGQVTLALVGIDPSPTDAAVDIGVMRSAGRFNSERFAQGVNVDDVKNARTWSAWISLTESAAPFTGRMPILSNISDDCSSGARLELRACGSDHSNVVVALGIPNGRSSSTSCTLDYVFAPFSANSYRGGFFTPWKTGTWFHVAATFDPASGRAASKIYLDGVRAETPAIDCSFAAVANELHDGRSIYLGSHAAMATAFERSHDLLIDEVALFFDAWGPEYLTRLLVQTSTIDGASGLRWGSWASQGSGARLESTKLPPTIIVDDREQASAGGYALLAANPLAPTPADLSAYDEAVLVVSGPPTASGFPSEGQFQFSLISDQGKRQCTWQLRANPAPSASDIEGPETYVVDLRSPSWCVDPQCRFDATSVERATIGSYWRDAQQPFGYSVQALAFRKRSGSNATAGILGGVTGPSGWCWKSVAYDSDWELQRPAQLSLSPEAISVRADTPIYFGNAEGPPQLAADLPENDGSRDLRGCTTMKLGLELLSTPVAANLGYDRQLVIQSEAGQTCSWPLPGSVAGVTSVALDTCNNWWPTTWTSIDRRQDLLRAVTRISIGYSGSMQVNSVACCDANDNCVDIGKLVPAPTAN